MHTKRSHRHFAPPSAVDPNHCFHFLHILVVYSTSSFSFILLTPGKVTLIVFTIVSSIFFYIYVIVAIHFLPYFQFLFSILSFYFILSSFVSVFFLLCFFILLILYIYQSLPLFFLILSSFFLPLYQFHHPFSPSFLYSFSSSFISYQSLPLSPSPFHPSPHQPPLLPPP